MNLITSMFPNSILRRKNLSHPVTISPVFSISTPKVGDYVEIFFFSKAKRFIFFRGVVVAGISRRAHQWLKVVNFLHGTSLSFSPSSPSIGWVNVLRRPFSGSRKFSNKLCLLYNVF